MSVKQVIVVRKDLKMRRGKEIAQGSHGSGHWSNTELLAAFRENRPPVLTPWQEEWLGDGRWAKTVLQTESEEELLAVYEAAKAAGLDAQLITDSGTTEFHGVPTNTCVSIGPDLKIKIDEITGPQGKFPLKLY